ncbi:MAG: hypothetical protein KDD62_08395 [Bdellovibrionales bacterium]|nr:hypothetical protein [Bdellovibrionales bacterium]
MSSLELAGCIADLAVSGVVTGSCFALFQASPRVEAKEESSDDVYHVVAFFVVLASAGATLVASAHLLSAFSIFVCTGYLLGCKGSGLFLGYALGRPLFRKVKTT